MSFLFQILDRGFLLCVTLAQTVEACAKCVPSVQAGLYSDWLKCAAATHATVVALLFRLALALNELV